MAVNSLQGAAASYVPTLVARQILEQGAALEAAQIRRFPAALLLADVSGFTNLTERLAREGPAGAEQLARILNEYFGHLIGLVLEHGGDVFKFAGDALLVLWQGTSPDDDLASLARRASQCGLAMQQPHELRSADDQTRLALRVSIGAGDLAVAHLGGVYGSWEYVAMGDSLTSIGAVSHQADPGQVGLTAEAAALLDTHAVLRPIGKGPARSGPYGPPGNAGASPATGWSNSEGAILEGFKSFLPPRRAVPVELQAQTEAILRGYLPGTVRSKLDAGQHGWLAELRRVTVLFVNLPDLNHQTPLEQAQEVVRRLQAAVYRFEGSVNKLSVDEKGISMLAAMGLPPLAHEDDAVRAVQAGITIRDALTGLGVRYGIGITTGQAFCGEVGNSSRREYTMMGDVVNRAARLMQAAVNRSDLLCDGPTQQASAARVKLESLGKIAVKGKAEEVDLFRPLAELKKQDRAAKLVGRMMERAEVEMALLELQSSPIFLEGAEAGFGAGSAQGTGAGGEGTGAGAPAAVAGGGVIVVEGDAGMGKSALVMFYVLQSRVLGFNTLIGNADAVERSTPYFAWRPIFTNLFKVDSGAQDLAARRAAVVAVLEEDPELAPWAPLLNPLLPLDFPENDQTLPLAGQVRAARTNELLMKLLQRASLQGPTMLVIEDAHWLDSASWALLRQVCHAVRPLLVVVASRPIPDPVPAEYRQILDSPGARRQLLGPLQPDEIELMLCRRLEVRKMPKELVAFIVERAGGHPFFSEEVALALRDGGYITTAGSECHLAPKVGDLRSLDLPDTVQGLITSRIDRVTPAQQLTLKVASVIGRSFPLRILKSVFPIEEDRPKIGDYLAAMERLDLTPLETPPPDTIYMFAHMITHEVVYNLMLFSQRRELHQKVAEWFETTFETDLEPYFPLLAHHWSKAEQPAKSAAYYEKAGEQALTTGAYLEAARFFELALETDNQAQALGPRASRLPHEAQTVTGDRHRRARWERLMGQAFLGAGRTIEAREHLKRALAALGSPLPDTRVGLHAEVVVAGWKETWARMRTETSWGAGRDARPTRALSWTGEDVSRAPSSSRVGLRADPHAAAAVDPTTVEIARAYGSLCEIFIQNNEPLELEYSCLRMLNLTRQLGPSPELSRAFGFLGTVRGASRRHSEAENYLRWARETEERVGDLPTRVSALVRDGAYHLTHGDWATASDVLDKAITLCDHLGDVRQRADAAVILAQGSLYAGDIRRSRMLFADLYEGSRDSGHIQPQCRGLSGQVSCMLRLGELQEAIEHLEQNLHLQESNPERMALLVWHGQMALAYARAARPDLAWKEAQAVERLIVDTPIIYAPDAYFGLAEVYWIFLDGPPERWPVAKRELRKLLGKAVGRGRKLARRFAVAEPQAWLWQGFFDWARGRRNPALRAWRRSLEAARRLAMPYEEGLAALELGRHLPATDPDRRRLLDAAVKQFSKLGAGDERRARKEIGQDTWSAPAPPRSF